MYKTRQLWIILITDIVKFNLISILRAFTNINTDCVYSALKYMSLQLHCIVNQTSGSNHELKRTIKTEWRANTSH